MYNSSQMPPHTPAFPPSAPRPQNKIGRYGVFILAQAGLLSGVVYACRHAALAFFFFYCQPKLLKQGVEIEVPSRSVIPQKLLFEGVLPLLLAVGLLFAALWFGKRMWRRTAPAWQLGVYALLGAVALTAVRIQALISLGALYSNADPPLPPTRWMHDPSAFEPLALTKWCSGLSYTFSACLLLCALLYSISKRGCKKTR